MPSSSRARSARCTAGDDPAVRVPRTGPVVQAGADARRRSDRVPVLSLPIGCRRLHAHDPRAAPPAMTQLFASLERVLSFRRVPMRAVVLTAFLSYLFRSDAVVFTRTIRALHRRR